MTTETTPSLAMQYRFVLPADYDMAIIERRIADKGPSLDGLPGLRFKAYLSARRDRGARENLYAPFYVWNETPAMSDFLTGRGFAGVSDAFGWPQVRSWIVWRARIDAAIAQARFATREIAAIDSYAPLDALQSAENAAAQAAIEAGALAALSGFEPTHWTAVRFRLWRDAPQRGNGQELYDVGHVSLGRASAHA